MKAGVITRVWMAVGAICLIAVLIAASGCGGREDDATPDTTRPATPSASSAQ